jgi:hypothetical protein
MAVAKDAPVAIDGKRGTLADLRSGMHVVLQMSPQSDERVAVAVIITTAKNP